MGLSSLAWASRTKRALRMKPVLKAPAASKSKIDLTNAHDAAPEDVELSAVERTCLSVEATSLETRDRDGAYGA